MLFWRNTLLTMLSALIMAACCILPATRDSFPFWIMAAGMHMADTLFHEMGHTLFMWLFGIPAIPMILTFFGADQAGGMSLPLHERLWFLQVSSLIVLAYVCYWSWNYWRELFLPAVIFSVAIAACALTKYYMAVILFMGHGGSIAMGSFFLFRAWLNLDARNGFERWLNAFFGFFLTLYNIYFAYTLAFDAFARSEYSEHVAFGISHNDFAAITDEVVSWSVKGVAIFTIAYGMAAITAPFVAALIWRLRNGKRLPW